MDGAGNLVIADTVNDRVRVVAASTGTFYGQAMTAGDIYTVAGTARPGSPVTAARPPAPSSNVPAGVAVDGAGNLLIADTGNNRVRVVAASTGTFYGQAMTAGDIYTVAGNGTPGSPATAARPPAPRLEFPGGVAVDAAGNLLIADTGNDRVRVVAASTGTFYGQAMTAGDIYTVAGNGTPGVLRRRRPGHQRRAQCPAWVAVDAAGNLVIADTGNNRVRVVAASTGTFYGQAMTAGDIYTVAGNGTAGFSGDGGPPPAPSSTSPRPGCRCSGASETWRWTAGT